MSEADRLRLGHAVVLGAVQGLTEFVPVSSSAHLAALPRLLGWDSVTRDAESKKALDIALHLGSAVGGLSALMSDVREVAGRPRSLALLSLSTLPSAVAGAALRRQVVHRLGTPRQLAVLLAVPGIALWLADRTPGSRTQVTSADAAAMGLAQAVALAPGVSRTGATLTAARWRGLDRASSTRWSLLMALPVVTGAGVLGLAAADREELVRDAPALVAGAATAAVTGAVGARLGRRWLSQHGYAPLAVYRVLVGLFLWRRALAPTDPNGS